MKGRVAGGVSPGKTHSWVPRRTRLVNTTQLRATTCPHGLKADGQGRSILGVWGAYRPGCKRLIYSSQHYFVSKHVYDAVLTRSTASGGQAVGQASSRGLCVPLDDVHVHVLVHVSLMRIARANDHGVENETEVRRKRKEGKSFTLQTTRGVWLCAGPDRPFKRPTIRVAEDACMLLLRSCSTPLRVLYATYIRYHTHEPDPPLFVYFVVFASS